MSGYIRREVELSRRMPEKRPMEQGFVYGGSSRKTKRGRAGGETGGETGKGFTRPRFDARDMFKNVAAALREKLKTDSVASYSITDSDIADAMTRRIRKYAPDARVVTDATACVGGNTASFAREFEVVHAIELDPKRAEYLEHNMAVLGLKNVDVIHGDAIIEVPKLRQEVLYMDVPWLSDKTGTEAGVGKHYRDVDRLELFLGDMLLQDVCKLFTPHCRVLALKVPKNFALAKFIHDTFDEYTLLDIMTDWRTMNLVILESKHK